MSLFPLTCTACPARRIMRSARLPAISIVAVAPSDARSIRQMVPRELTSTLLTTSTAPVADSATGSATPATLAPTADVPTAPPITRTEATGSADSVLIAERALLLWALLCGLNAVAQRAIETAVSVAQNLL